MMSFTYKVHLSWSVRKNYKASYRVHLGIGDMEACLIRNILNNTSQRQRSTSFTYKVHLSLLVRKSYKASHRVRLGIGDTEACLTRNILFTTSDFTETVNEDMHLQGALGSLV